MNSAGPQRDGQIIANGRYRLLRPLGKGTFGDVYLAESLYPAFTGGEKEAVIKILHPQWAGVPEVLERFKRESQVTQKIEHPHVARIFEHSQLEDGVPFLAMEYLPGISLRDRIERGSIPPNVAFGILAAIAEALGAAHRAGVVHRDLKPENIQMIRRNDNDEYPVVLDFGVAKLLDAAEKLTMTGALLGTPVYMSPEQFRGESDLGPASDVYALGVLAHDVLTGQPPFLGQTFAELAIAHTAKTPPELRNAPKILADIIFKCLDKDPAKRPKADAVAQTLRGLKAGAPVSQLIETAVDPYGATGQVGVDVLSTVRTAAESEVQRQKRQKLLTVMMALAVFVLTTAVGLAVYFLLG